MGRRNRIEVWCAIVVMVLTFIGPARAADELKFQVGDIVSFRYALKELEGEVTDVRNSFITVKFTQERDGKSQERTTTTIASLAKLVRRGGLAPEKVAANLLDWSDDTGKFKIRAAFVKIDKDEVELQKEDGTTLRIALDKLSPAGREQANAAAAKLKAAATEEQSNPFKTVGPARSTEKPSAGGLARAGSSTSKPSTTEPEKPKREREKPTPLEEKPVDWTKAEVFDAGAPTGAAFTPDAQLKPLAGRNPGIALTTGERSTFGTSGRVFIAAQAQRALVATQAKPSIYDQERTTVETCDLTQGNSIGAAELPATGIEVIDVSPSGDRLLGKLDGASTSFDGRLDVFQRAGKEWKHLVSFRPKGLSAGDSGYADAKFLNEEHVLTWESRRLTKWKAAEAQAVWSVDISKRTGADGKVEIAEASARPSFSASRKYLAVMSAGGIVVLSSDTGRVVRRLETRSAIAPRFAFSPDGSRLALADTHGVETWDIATGKLIDEVSLEWGGCQALDWVQDGYLLASHFTGAKQISVVDLKRRIILWRYNTEGGGLIAGSDVWYVGGARNAAQVLRRVAVPDAEAIAMAGTLDPEKLLMLKPGAEFAIAVEGKVSDEARAELVKVLTASLTEIGMKVVEKSSLVLLAKVDQRAEVKSQGFTSSRSSIRGSLGGSGHVTVTYGGMELSVQESGKTLWKTTGSRGSSTYSVFHGRVVNYSSQHRSLLDFFAESKLPRYLAKAGPNGTYGRSSLADR